MDLVCIFDSETTSMDPTTGVAIEVAAVSYSVKHHAVVEAFSRVMETADTNPLEHINHIPSGILRLGYGKPMDAWTCIQNVAAGCEAILAHNSDFDRQWVPKLSVNFLATPWIDTLAIDWPKQSRPGSSLINLALDHGLGVVDPHRALQDCLLLARLLTRVAELGHDVETILAKGLRPRGTVEAIVSYEDRDKAKEHGFHWDQKTKKWTRSMFFADCAALPFPVKTA